MNLLRKSEQQEGLICEVWKHNFKSEMLRVMDRIDLYPYVAMDTEFPGTIARPYGNFNRLTTEYTYQLLRCNVDLLKIIQLGITLSDENGNVPKDTCTWQFNFHYIIDEEMYAPDSIDLLKRSGINFEKHALEGIDPHHFGELLISSGLVLNPKVNWISFHGYMDFGYLYKVVTARKLASIENDFLRELELYFPANYDIKYLMRSCKNLKGGLQDVADDMEVIRIGQKHQAGSDSLLTCITFFKMRKIFFEDNIDDSKYKNRLYGLGSTFIPNTTNIM